MTVLKQLRELKGGYMLLYVATDVGVEKLTVTGRAYRDAGSPTVGEEIEAVISDIRLSDEYYRAERKALSLLAYADNNKKNLMAKLQRAGFSRDVSSDTVEEMVRLGYVKEDEQLKRLILNEANVKLSGRYKLLPKLLAKGYSKGLVDRILDELVDLGEVDFELNRRKLLATKLGDDRSPEVVAALLYKYGYHTY